MEPEQLDWLVRETLGLGTHRLDAWHTSLASERLAAMRDGTADGVYVGHYGFVLDLRRAGERPSHGFIHAPSLAHAASAAVLRSGWLARGSNDQESPAAIDLASGRVRDADWLLSGVRQGQDLGDLLGASFERRLHDARLDVAIRPIREAVIVANGLADSALDVPVDGIELLDLHRAGGLGADDRRPRPESAKKSDLVDLLGAARIDVRCGRRRVDVRDGPPARRRQPRPGRGRRSTAWGRTAVARPSSTACGRRGTR